MQWTWLPRVGVCDILFLCSLLTLLPQLHANTSLLCTDTALHPLPDTAPPMPLRNRGTEIARGHTGLEGSSTQGLWVRSPPCLGEGQTSPGSLPETVEPGKSVLPAQGPYGETEAGSGDGGLGLHLAAVHGRGSRALLNCGCVLPPLWSQLDLLGTQAFGGREGQSRKVGCGLCPPPPHFTGVPRHPSPTTDLPPCDAQPMRLPPWTLGRKGLLGTPQRTGWKSRAQQGRRAALWQGQPTTP